MIQEIYQRYLHVLGIAGEPRGLDGLREIVLRHLCRVPFENVSKLLMFASEGAGRFFTLDEFLDGIEHRDYGGTCYSNNIFLAGLLRALGYDTDLLGADMGRGANVHTCLRVRLEGAAYHVDVGYGGPFRAPIRLDQVPCEIVEGGRHLLEARGDAHEMSVFSGEERVHGYLVHEPPRTPDFFTPPMLHSFRDGATFLNCIRICRFFEDYSVVLLNRTLSIHRKGHTSSVELQTPAEWGAALADELRMPRCPWQDAIAALERNTGAPFFSTQTAQATG